MLAAQITLATFQMRRTNEMRNRSYGFGYIIEIYLSCKIVKIFEYLCEVVDFLNSNSVSRVRQ